MDTGAVNAPAVAAKTRDSSTDFMMGCDELEIGEELSSVLTMH